MKCIVTDYAAKEYWKESEKPLEKVEDCMHVINLYPQITGQTIQGFGGAFTEASVHNYSRMSRKKQEEILKAYFSEEGLRYNMGRTHINSCDFGLGNYAYVEEGDDRLETFSIAHDEAQMIPMILKAMKETGEEMVFLASPWSPPAFMKTNGEMNHGGKLKKEYYQTWADYFVKYIRAYEAAGIKISYVTVQNEPMAVQTWDSCIYETEEEKEFVKNYLGPTLQKEGLSHIKIFVWDHNKEELVNRVSPIFEDAEASQYITGAAVHWYTGDHFEAIEAIKAKYPDKEVFFTEGCVEYSRFADSGEVQKAEMYAHDMLGNLKAGISAFLDWNLLLDEKGGPNHVGNFCAAPLMCCPEADELEKRLSYYYIGHFSRYIKRGAKKIAVTRYSDQIEAVGFLNPDGERVLVVLNKTEKEAEITIRENGMGGMYTIKPHTIATFIYHF